MAYGLKRPSKVEKANQKEMKFDDLLRSAHNVRAQVQRRFDSPRLKRAVAYAEYLQAIYTGERIGGYPPITLYTPYKGQVSDDGRTLILPYNIPLVNLDGETQTEARYLLLEADEESKGYEVPFILYHGISEEHASVIMHDVNFYAKPVPEQKIAVLNSQGHLTRIVNDVLGELNIPSHLIARLSPRPRKHQLVAYPALIAGAAGALVGRVVTNNLPACISRLNNYSNGAKAANAKPFLEHGMKFIHQVGRCKPVIWALVGGYYHDTGNLLSAPDWLKVSDGYETAKFPRGTAQQALLKREAAFRAINVES